MLASIALRFAGLTAVIALVLTTPGTAMADEDAPAERGAVDTATTAARGAVAHQRDHTHEHPDAHAADPEHVDPAPPGIDVRRHVPASVLLTRWHTQQERKLEAVLGSTRWREGTGRDGGSGDQEADVAASAVPAGVSALPGLATHAPRSCVGTGSDGNRVQVLYVVEADDPDRYDAVLPMLQNELANVDDTFVVSAAKTGGARRVRWVFTSGATCEPEITKVVVPAGSLVDFSSSVVALKNAGFTNARRKYLVFADTAVLCGVGHIYRDDKPVRNANDGNASAMFARVDTACWLTTSRGSTAAHELMHNMGGVQASAPHPTPYGHCTDRYELMCYNDGSGAAMADVCSTGHAPLFDCRDDDYFSTAPAAGSYLATYWNTANSSFLDATPVAAPAAPPPAPGPAPAVSAPASPPTPDPATPVPAPTVTVDGPASLLPGLSAQLTATGSGAGSYAWTLSQPNCAQDAGTAAVLTIRCSAEDARPLTARVTFQRADGSTATATHTVTAATGRTTLTPSISATRTSVTTGSAVTLTAGLRRASTPVRGRVGVSASTDGRTWKPLLSPVDTGADGVARFVVRPSRTTHLRLVTALPAGSGWSLPRDPTIRISIKRAATTLTIAAATSRERPLVSGRLAVTAPARPLAGRKVVLQFRAVGAPQWRAVRTATSSSTGRVSATVPTTRSGFYRWRYAGSATERARTSSSTYVR